MRSRNVRWISILLAALLATAADAAEEKNGKPTPKAEAKVGTKSLDPEATVRAYLSALQEGDFEEAYRYIGPTLRQGKSREEWAKEQQWIAQMAEVKIFGYEVYPGKVEGDRARVPNVLDSQDKYLNQLGVTEHELYTLEREDGQWKILQQQLVEPGDKEKWFPTE